MDEKKKNKRIGSFYFITFVLLIAGGIITKRVYGHPEFMMAWHLPAAVFLVLSGMKFAKNSKEAYMAHQKKANQDRL